MKLNCIFLHSLHISSVYLLPSIQRTKRLIRNIASFTWIQIPSVYGSSLFLDKANQILHKAVNSVFHHKQSKQLATTQEAQTLNFNHISFPAKVSFLSYLKKWTHLVLDLGMLNKQPNKHSPWRSALLTSVCRLANQLLGTHIKQHVNIPTNVTLVRLDAGVALLFKTAWSGHWHVHYSKSYFIN